MPLSPKQVAALAQLSRVALSPRQTDSLSLELVAVAELTKQVEQVVSSRIDDRSQPAASLGSLREDAPLPSFDITISLSGAPKARDHFFVVPRVLK